jgi:glycosyltransferase involved in cell wall biosynthesis
MSTPKVSVLMSVFNTQACLGEAIESVLNQTLTDIELIIIDDCSTDDSWPIVLTYARQDSRVVALQNEKNNGASLALNSGLARVRSEYITRHDSDDVSLPCRLQKQVAFLERNPEVGAVGASVLLIDSEGKPLRIASFPRADEDIQSALLDYMCFCGPTVMVRRPIFEKIGFRFNDALSGAEDYDLCLRLAEVTRLANLEEPLYQYRQHGTSVSHRLRFHQLLRKAIALEQAIHRRFGPVPSGRALTNVARDYLRVAVLGQAGGEFARSHDCLARALVLNRDLFNDTGLVEKIVRKYTPRSSVRAALNFTEGLFRDLFPANRRLRRMKRRLISELHVQEVFLGASRKQHKLVDKHLWPAVRTNPTWLMNRGILTLLFRQAIARRGIFGRGVCQ